MRMDLKEITWRPCENNEIIECTNQSFQDEVLISGLLLRSDDAILRVGLLEMHLVGTPEFEYESGW
jgi:hypothetical protein